MAASVVIDPSVMVLAAPKMDVASMVDGILTHCVPFQPTMVSVFRLLFVRVGISLCAFQVKEILAAVAPLMSQYSLFVTVVMLVALDVIGNGAPIGKATSLPPCRLLVIAVVFRLVVRQQVQAEEEY